MSKAKMAVVRMTDKTAEALVRLELASAEQAADYRARVLERFSCVKEFDDWSPVDIYRCVCAIRRDVFGSALDVYDAMQAKIGVEFVPAIDQSHKLAQAIAKHDTLTVVLTQPELTGRMEADLRTAQGKRILQWKSLPEKPEGAVLYYGEEGLLECRNLPCDAVVTAIPEGFHAQAVTNLWSGEGCVVYIPAGFDITPHVPMAAKTRLTFAHLALLERQFGDGVYTMAVETLYKQYPAYFGNIYHNAPTALPVPRDAESLVDFDRRRDALLEDYLGSLAGVKYESAYFDANLQRQTICYDAQQPQDGILVQAVRVERSAGAQVLSCPKGVTPREMFARMGHRGTALVSNFLFFMTPKLGVLYNDLRQDRIMEQADAASGHLDYMLQTREGIETFPLFGKTCIGMDEGGNFRFWNYFMGGGSVELGGICYRWEAGDVNGQGQTRLYTPMHSARDAEADRDTYRKTVGEGRVNVVLLRERVSCIRKGNVVLPSVGVVLSLTEEAAQPLLSQCKALADGYYAVDGLQLRVRLDAPEGFSPEEWSRMQWAYGGGLTLIRKGVGLCDGQHMQQWFDAEGWSSPLSRQTQESNLHSLVKHPRTAIGCAKDGSLLILVYSGRTWRSTGADYKEMIAIARALFPDVDYLMNGDGGGSAMLGMVKDGEFMELSFPSTSANSCAGQVRPINTVFYIPIEEA